jgi:archaellum component FlaC
LSKFYINEIKRIRGGGGMVKLITVKKAQEEIERLQEYIDLVDSYEVNTLDTWIIKEYALTNSIKEVKNIKERIHSKLEYKNFF